MIRKSIAVSVVLFFATAACAEGADRTITVSGTGHAEAAPDKATVTMSVEARDRSLAAAQKEVADVTNKVLSMTDGLDIDRSKVGTTGASVNPDYRWNRDTQEQEFRGYIARRNITVVVEDLEQLGEVVEGAVAAGVNQVSPPVMDSTKRRETHRLALKAAADDARANAQTLAKALDANLGKVIEISSGSQMPQPPMPRVRGVAEFAAADGMAMQVQSYNAADLTFHATATVVFELTD